MLLSLMNYLTNASERDAALQNKDDDRWQDFWDKS